MSYNYYLDESGNSGDLVKAKFDLEFGQQPLFTLSCIGIDDFSKAEKFIHELRDKHRVSTVELKSSEIYRSKPGAILELARFLTQEHWPILTELVDKKYCVATSITTHQIMPSYFAPDESNGVAQSFRNMIADYLALNLTDECYEAFFVACDIPSESNLLKSMRLLEQYFRIHCKDEKIASAAKLVAASIDDYERLKILEGEDRAVRMFIPIPDTTEKGREIRLLPHVHSINNIIGRINKYHLQKISGVTLYHDEQKEFGKILIACNDALKGYKYSETETPTPHANFNFTEELKIEFVKSELNVGTQIADLVAGYFGRFINGLLYKKLDMPEIYWEIYSEFSRNFRPMSPLGLNLVIPESMRAQLRYRF